MHQKLSAAQSFSLAEHGRAHQERSLAHTHTHTCSICRAWRRRPALCAFFEWRTILFKQRRTVGQRDAGSDGRVCSEFGLIRVRVGQTRANCGQVRCRFVGSGADFAEPGHMWPAPGQIQNWAHVGWPAVVEANQEVGACFPEPNPKLAGVSPDLVEADPTQARTCGRHQFKLGRTKTQFCQHLPNCGRHQPNVLRTQPRFGRTQAALGRKSCKFGRDPPDRPCAPAVCPTGRPDGGLTIRPTVQPPDVRLTALPSARSPDCPPDPTIRPTNNPADRPDGRPTVHPTVRRTGPPPLHRPPTVRPSVRHPTDRPTVGPDRSLDRPTSPPTARPTVRPANRPTTRPSDNPTARPSDQWTVHPPDRPSTRARPSARASTPSPGG